MKILVLNGGSSSFKCWFQDVPDGQLPSEGLAPRWSARADWSRNSGTADVKIARSDGASVTRTITADSPSGFLEPVLEALWKGDDKAIDAPSEIDVVGHRIVHGGPKYRESVLVTSGRSRRQSPNRRNSRRRTTGCSLQPLKPWIA